VRFEGIKNRLQTDRFTHFGSAKMNNAYLLSIGLYHRHFHLFEAVLEQNGNSIKETISFLRQFAKEKGDILERLQDRGKLAKTPRLHIRTLMDALPRTHLFCS
jgi:hypothetical protein